VGYPKISKFDKLLIDRTIKNLENYRGDYDFTFLLSQTLALLILPVEFYKRGLQLKYDFLNKKIENKKLINIFNTKKEVRLCSENDKVFKRKKAYFRTNKGVEKDLSKIKAKELFSKLRNSIAHWGITPVKSGNSWEGVILINKHKNKEKKVVETMDVYLTKNELKELCLYIAKKWKECSK